jgi:hypothetical protein
MVVSEKEQREDGYDMGHGIEWAFIAWLEFPSHSKVPFLREMDIILRDGRTKQRA